MQCDLLTTNTSVYFHWHCSIRPHFYATQLIKFSDILKRGITNFLQKITIICITCMVHSITFFVKTIINKFISSWSTIIFKKNLTHLFLQVETLTKLPGINKYST